MALALPPEEPSGTGAVNGCMLSESIVNPTDCDTEVLACEMAVTVTVAGSVLLAISMIVFTVGTVFGAVYMPPGVIEPQTEPVAPQVSCQVTAVLLVPVTAAANCTVWNVSMFITFVVMDTVIVGGGGVLPPPPQDTIVMAPATTRVLSRQARLIMELSLQSDVHRCGIHPSYPPFNACIGRTAIRRNRYGNLSL
jgi:hypothetical protein